MRSSERVRSASAIRVAATLARRERARLCAFAVGLACSALAWRAQAQQQPQGFAVERFYPSAAGGGWFVMDALDMHGALGGAMAITSGYALNSLRIPDGSTHLPVVSHQAFTTFSLAATYDRFRFYLDLTSPLVVSGDSGTASGYTFTAPSADLGQDPDVMVDARVGFDARIIGDERSAFRLGAGAQVFIPSGNSADYETDGTYRAMVRLLAAGDVGAFTYAGQLGVHIRPFDESPVPQGPQGSELLFGVAGGLKLPVSDGTRIVIGPEIYGETALESFFGGPTTGVEALLTSRIEGTGDDGQQLRVKLGSGGGLDPQFGAPEWRFIIGLEVFDHSAKRAREPSQPLHW
jgi:hypothetical protein